ncbi:hypothetical protein Ancab_011105 [Ancistrocladus abbreviatus]
MEAGGGGGRYELRSRSGKTSGKGSSSSSSMAEVLEKKRKKCSTDEEDSIPEDSQPILKEASPVREEASSTAKQKLEESKWDEQGRDCAYMGLNAWNKQQKLKQGCQYELVRPLSTNGWLRGKKGFVFHTNFEAKPIGASRDKREMFFVENLLSNKRVNKRLRKVEKVTLCVPVQRPDHGCSDDEIYRGCNCCRARRAHLYHPASGGFDVGPILGGHTLMLRRLSPMPDSVRMVRVIS